MKYSHPCCEYALSLLASTTCVASGPDADTSRTPNARTHDTGPCVRYRFIA
jgi:hypothetical protein